MAYWSGVKKSFNAIATSDRYVELGATQSVGYKSWFPRVKIIGIFGKYFLSVIVLFKID